jgi:hypothetical protein
VTPLLGDYGVQSGGGRGAWLIRLGTFSRWNHAAVVVQVDPLRIVEAMGSGARERDCGVDEFTWSRCQLTDGQRSDIAVGARECIGLPYDYRDIVGFVSRFFGRKTRLWPSHDHGNDRLICSELVAWCYREGGHEAAIQSVAAGDVSPGDLGQHIVHCVHPAPSTTHAPPMSYCAACQVGG